MLMVDSFMPYSEEQGGFQRGRQEEVLHHEQRVHHEGRQRLEALGDKTLTG